MSIKNIDDGSYDIGAPVIEEKLEITVPILSSSVSIDLTFLKVGNVCSLKIGDFDISTSQSYVAFYGYDPAIAPFLPKETFTQDFNFIEDGLNTWGSFGWFPISHLFQISLPIPTGTKDVSVKNSQPILYNV